MKQDERGGGDRSKGGILQKAGGAGGHCPHADFRLGRQSCLCVENSKKGSLVNEASVSISIRD